MSIASVTPTSAFPQSAPGIQPYGTKSSDTAPTSQADTDPHHHPAPPWGPGTTTSQATAGAATATASLNTVA
jgi:hypothetical protein